MTRLGISFRFIALALALTLSFQETHSLYLGSRSERNAQPAKEARTPATNPNELVTPYTLDVRQNYDLSERVSIEERMFLPEPGSGAVEAGVEVQPGVNLEAQVVLSAVVCRMSHSLVRTGLGDSQGARPSQRWVKYW